MFVVNINEENCLLTSDYTLVHLLIHLHFCLPSSVILQHNWVFLSMLNHLLLLPPRSSSPAQKSLFPAPFRTFELLQDAFGQIRPLIHGFSRDESDLQDVTSPGGMLLAPRGCL